MARAPAAIRAAQDRIVGGVGGAVASGIVGDKNHSYGYHLARNELPGSDYSVQYAADRDGPADAASALDISLPPEQMTAVVSRLMDASIAGDPRLYALREWFGARSGEPVTGWDFRDDTTHVDDRITTADDSHKWHVHLSGYRRYADDAAAWAAIADVFTDSAPIGGALSQEDDDMTPEQDALLRQANENAFEARRLAGDAKAQTDPTRLNAAVSYVLTLLGVPQGVAELLGRPAAGAVADPKAVAAEFAALVGDDLAQDVIDALVARLAGKAA